MNSDFGFLEGFIYDENSIVVLASSEKLEDDGVDHAFVCHRKQGEWRFWYEEFPVVKACVIDGSAGATLIEMGANGELVRGDAKGFNRETIESGREAPGRLRPLNDLRIIGDHLYVAGMKRQVFRRPIARPDWQRFDSGLLVPKSSKEIAGFTSIDGFGSSEIYGVGYGGQIWRYDGRRWHQVASPTNLRLESVRCVAGEYVVAAGDEGIVLKGREDQWEIIGNDLTDEVLTDVESLGTRVLVSTEVGLLMELEGSKLVPVDFGALGEVTTGTLHGNGRLLLSVGEGDLLLFDGEKWKPIAHPELPSV